MEIVTTWDVTTSLLCCRGAIVASSVRVVPYRGDDGGAGRVECS